MQLVLLHPKVAYRDCEDCKKWMYDEKTGKRALRHGRPQKRVGKPPCAFRASSTETRCPKGTPYMGRALTPQNEQAYRYYLECKATGQFPDDPIVRANAGIIRRVEEMVERYARQAELEAVLLRLRASRG